MRYEAGVTEITYPYAPRWTGITVEAATKAEAETQFGGMGFYRNLVVRVAVSLSLDAIMADGREYHPSAGRRAPR